MSELLPCPFCGCEPELIEYESDDCITLYVVACTNEDCNMTVDTGSYGNQREATAEWNTRAPMSYEDLKILLDELGVSERTCNVDEVVDDNWEYRVWTFELSCGHDYESTQKEPPNYCPNCGCKVVTE